MFLATRVSKPGRYPAYALSLVHRSYSGQALAALRSISARIVLTAGREGTFM